MAEGDDLAELVLDELVKISKRLDTIERLVTDSRLAAPSPPVVTVSTPAPAPAPSAKQEKVRKMLIQKLRAQNPGIDLSGCELHPNVVQTGCDGCSDVAMSRMM